MTIAVSDMTNDIVPANVWVLIACISYLLELIVAGPRSLNSGL